ncbi:cytidylyltransferase domain-containing protein [Flagellimonas meridianipacifica]|uniref:Spore coat polysaccharide biosynthesis protein SpsF n=1 Tax=Flagellimonas meridianipacifica TaxID=1080225 RepID=A0A2T0MH70_9FLAO|nr:hypothetical protein [Allomuricauda pacifica]PRX56928.1 spore coat polysaccharide biosynthesis protein SpsF [Allomuricauda pacifica]
MSKVGIIVQARVGSNRLPKKILLPFYDNMSILEILLQKLVKLKNKYPILLATSINSGDDVLEKFATKFQIGFYRGSENNVLERFIETAKQYEIDIIVRVCSDNPFLDINHISELIEIFYKNKSFDYYSYKNDEGMPVVRTHLGLFAEIVTLKALEKTNKSSEDLIYQEHVTNYIYSNPEIFRIYLKEAFPEVFSRKDLRFTIDNIDDFNNLSKLYGMYKKFNYSIVKTIDFLDRNPSYRTSMMNNIAKYSK